MFVWSARSGICWVSYCGIKFNIYIYMDRCVPALCVYLNFELISICLRFKPILDSANAIHRLMSYYTKHTRVCTNMRCGNTLIPLILLTDSTDFFVSSFSCSTHECSSSLTITRSLYNHRNTWLVQVTDDCKKKLRILN